jgi:hypothetical protein
MDGKKVLIGDDSMIFTGDLGSTEYIGDGNKTITELTGTQAGKSDVKRIIDRKSVV